VELGKDLRPLPPVYAAVKHVGQRTPSRRQFGTIRTSEWNRLATSRRKSMASTALIFRRVLDSELAGYVY
jgi:hypothetical protein